MIEKTVTISAPEGLTSKNVTALIAKANEFPCMISLEYSSRRVNCKSLLGVLSLGLKCGDAITLSAIGEGEEAAVDTISAML